MKYYIFILLVFLFISCDTRQNCRDLNGRWTNNEGQSLVFLAQNQGLWLTQFGSHTDSFTFKYLLDCNTKTPWINISDFSDGPHAAHALYGIIEWTSDSSIRLCYEAGPSAEVRPVEFDPEQTVKFVKKDN